MIEIVKFNAMHLPYVDLIDQQAHMADLFNSEEYQHLLHCGYAYTALANGHVICCAGVFPIAPHIGRAWALMGKRSADHMIDITRNCLHLFDTIPVPRIETMVCRDYEKGHRWVRMMGFVNETPDIGMRGYGMNGETYDLYSKVKNDNQKS